MKSLIEHQKVRFVIAGLCNTMLDFLLLNAMVFVLHLPVLVANCISVSVGITVSYFLNHYFVFRSRKRLTAKSYFAFFGVTGFSSLIIQGLIIFGFETLFMSNFGHSLLVIGSFYGHRGLQLNVAKATAVLLGMVWNFMLYKYVIFKEDSGASMVELEQMAEESEQ